MPPICFISSEGKEVYVKNGKTAALFSQVLRDAVSAWSTQYKEEDEYVHYNINNYIVGPETEKKLNQVKIKEKEQEEQEVELQPKEQIDWNHIHHPYREYDEWEESEEEEEEEEVDKKKEEKENLQVLTLNDKMQEAVHGPLHSSVTVDEINASSETNTVKPNYLIVRKNKHKKRRQHQPSNWNTSESFRQPQSPEEEEEYKKDLAGSAATETSNTTHKSVDETINEQQEYEEKAKPASNNKYLSPMHKSRQKHRKGQSGKKMNYTNIQFVTSSVITTETDQNNENVNNNNDVFLEPEKEVLEEHESEEEKEKEKQNIVSSSGTNIDNVMKDEGAINSELDICSNNNINNDMISENETEGTLAENEQEEKEYEESEECEEEEESEESEEVESDYSDNSCTLEELELMLEYHKENEENGSNKIPCFVEEETKNTHYCSNKDHNEEDVEFIKSVLTAPECSNELPMKLQKLDKSLLEEKLRQRRHSLHSILSLNSTYKVNVANYETNNLKEENESGGSSTKDKSNNEKGAENKRKETVCIATLPQIEQSSSSSPSPSSSSLNSFTNSTNVINVANVNESQLSLRSHNTTPSSYSSSLTSLSSESLSSPRSAMSTLSSTQSSSLNRRTSVSSVKSSSVIIKKIDENMVDTLYNSDNDEIEDTIDDNNEEKETNYITNYNGDNVNEKGTDHLHHLSSGMNYENDDTYNNKRKGTSTIGQTRHVDPFDLPEYHNEEEKMYNSHVTHGTCHHWLNNAESMNENYCNKESVEYLSSTPGLTSNMNNYCSSLNVENNTHTFNEQKENDIHIVTKNECCSNINNDVDDDDDSDTCMALHLPIDGWNSMNYNGHCLSANDQPSHSELDNDDYLNWQSPRSFHQRTPCMIEMEDSPNAVRLLSFDGTEMILRTSYGHEDKVENENEINTTENKYANDIHGSPKNNMNSYLEQEQHTEQVDNKNNDEENYNIIITEPKMSTLQECENQQVENISYEKGKFNDAQWQKHEEEMEEEEEEEEEEDKLEAKVESEKHVGTENVTDLEFCHRRMSESAIVFDFQQSQVHTSCNNTEEEEFLEKEEVKCLSEHVCKTNTTPPSLSLNEAQTISKEELKQQQKQQQEQQQETDTNHVTHIDSVDQFHKKCLPFSTHVLELCASFLNRLEENRLALEKSDALEKWKNIQLNNGHSDDENNNSEDDDDDEESNDSFVNTTVNINNTSSTSNGLINNGIKAGLSSSNYSASVSELSSLSSSSTLLMSSIQSTHEKITQRLLTPISATPLSSPLTAILSEWEIAYLYHDVLCYSSCEIAKLKWWTTLYPEFDFRCPALSIRMLKTQINKCEKENKVTNTNNMCTSDAETNSKCVNGKVNDVDESTNINKNVSTDNKINSNSISNHISSFLEFPIRTPVPSQHGVQTLMTLMKLAQVLQITELYNLCTAWIADHMLRCAYFDDDCFAAAQSIRTAFHIENDYTSKERECLAIENEWPADESEYNFFMSEQQLQL